MTRRLDTRALLLAVALGLWELPSASLMADDFIQLGVLEFVSPIDWLGPLDLYRFADGDPHHVQALKDAGALPWFAEPVLKLAFLRPLSSAAIALDHAAFGLHPTGYRLDVTLWMLALVYGLGKLYALVAGRVAGLALVLFTVSGMHAVFCWTATRHIVMAAAAGVLALHAHVRWREQDWEPGRVLSLVGFGVAFAAGEAALGLVAYLLAYEAFGARGRGRDRGRAALPVLALSVLYLGVYRVLDLGASPGSDYLDPLRDPTTYLAEAPARLLVVLGGMLSGGNDLWVLRPDFRPRLVVGGGVAIALVALAIAGVWRSTAASERRALRWLGAGAVLAAVPFLGTPIGSRCMVIPWIGGAAIVGIVLVQWWTAVRVRPGFAPRTVGMLCWGLVAVHLILGPAERLVVPYFLRQAMFVRLQRAVGDTAVAGEAVDGKTVIVLDAPDMLVGQYAFFFRQLYRLPMPAEWRVLSWAPCTHRFRRTAADTIELELIGGTVHAPHLSSGAVVQVTGMRAAVLAAAADGPTRIEFRFDRPLDDLDLVFLHWSGARFERVQPPAVGATVELARDRAI